MGSNQRAMGSQHHTEIEFGRERETQNLFWPECSNQFVDSCFYECFKLSLFSLKNKRNPWEFHKYLFYILFAICQILSFYKVYYCQVISLLFKSMVLFQIVEFTVHLISKWGFWYHLFLNWKFLNGCQKDWDFQKIFHRQLRRSILFKTFFVGFIFCLSK